MWLFHEREWKPLNDYIIGIEAEHAKAVEGWRLVHLDVFAPLPSLSEGGRDSPYGVTEISMIS